MSYDNWKNVKLKEIVEIKGGKRLPKGHSLVDYKTTHPYIRVRDLNNITKLEKFDGIQYIIEETFSNISRYITSYKDILLSIVGTIGLTCIVGKTLDNASLTENCVKLTNYSNEIEYRFLYYYLNSPNGIQEIRMGTVGAVQAKLPIKNIKNINVILPPLQEQKAIANILSSLDSKIELNNKINKNLEELARTLYKHWFVDFEFPNEEGLPYKSSGGKMVDSELGPIPYGWEVKEQGEYFPIITGKKNANYSTDDGEFNFFTCSQQIFKAPGYSFEGSAILVAGNGDFNVKYYKGKFEAYQRTYVLIPHNEKLSGLLYFLIKENLSEITSGHRGSVIKFITKGDLEKYKIIMPKDIQLLEQMSRQFQNIVNKIQHNNEENTKLAEMRDLLLPKLMSGEIRMPVEE